MIRSCSVSEGPSPVVPLMNSALIEHFARCSTILGTGSRLSFPSRSNGVKVAAISPLRGLKSLLFSIIRIPFKALHLLLLGTLQNIAFSLN